MFYSFLLLKVFPTLFFHKQGNFIQIVNLIIFDKQFLELRNRFFGYNQNSLSFGNQIMIGKYHGRTLISIKKYLCFHTVKAKPYCSINRIFFCLTDNFIDPVFYIQLNRQWRNIGATADSNGNTSDTSAIGKKALIDLFSDMAQKIIIAFAADYIFVENKLPSVFQIQTVQM